PRLFDSLYSLQRIHSRIVKSALIAWPRSSSMRTKQRVALLASALVVAVGASWQLGAVAHAQLPSASAALPTLPTAAEQWANSSPLTYEGMKGKAVVFWYFEEQCPSCAKKWVGLKELAQAHADDPVLFVG